MESLLVFRHSCIGALLPCGATCYTPEALNHRHQTALPLWDMPFAQYPFSIVEIEFFENHERLLEEIEIEDLGMCLYPSDSTNSWTRKFQELPLIPMEPGCPYPDLYLVSHPAYPRMRSWRVPREWCFRDPDQGPNVDKFILMNQNLYEARIRAVVTNFIAREGGAVLPVISWKPGCSIRLLEHPLPVAVVIRDHFSLQPWKVRKYYSTKCE